MEAMASGLPVIAVDAVALPELVKHKKNGFLFTPNDLKSLAFYITEILSNSKLQNKMSQESQRLIQQHDIKKTVNSYIKIYQKLIEAN
jgi:glycosyltransferase involved in cell wall biosynthesis